MPAVPTPLLTTLGLVGGFGVNRLTGRRPLGGSLLAVAGGAAAYRWQQRAGTPTAAVLTGMYVSAFGGSALLAKKIGAWPAVFAVTGAVAGASWLLTERGGAGGSAAAGGTVA